MKISVIIPVYNAEKYIENCLRSVLLQNFDDFEIITVIDGATDSSEEKIKSLQLEFPNKIKIIKQEQKGPGSARNVGIEAAAGEYLLFFDSDDYVHPELLNRVYETAESTKSDLVIYDIEQVDEEGHLINRLNAAGDGTAIVNFQDRSALLTLSSMCNKLCKRDLFLNNNILSLENIRMGEDLFVATQLLVMAEKKAYIHESLYYYVQRKESLVNSSKADITKINRNRDIITVFKALSEFLNSIGKYEEYSAELEFLTLYHVLFTASMRVNEIDSRSKIQNELVNYTVALYPHFERNKYYKTHLSKKDRVSIWFLRHKLFKTLHILLRINRKIRRR